VQSIDDSSTFLHERLKHNRYPFSHVIIEELNRDIDFLAGEYLVAGGDVFSLLCGAHVLYCDERDSYLLCIQSVKVLVEDPGTPDTVIDILLLSRALPGRQVAPVVLQARQDGDVFERLQCFFWIVAYGFTVGGQHVANVGESQDWRLAIVSASIVRMEHSRGLLGQVHFVDKLINVDLDVKRGCANLNFTRAFWKVNASVLWSNSTLICMSLEAPS
jgi:hypothetical protein